MNSEIVEKVRNFVEEESRKSTAKYGYHPYKFHFISVHDYALKLAKNLNVDIEIVEVASWLHDIGSVIYGRENHHLTGAEIAEQKLRELSYSSNRIQKVKDCILNHRGSINNIRKTLEEQIIADADTLSHFDNISGLFMAAFIYEKKGQGEAKDSVKNKLTNSWNKLSLKESKKLIKSKYEAAMLLLK